MVLKIAPEKQTDPIEEYAEDIHSFYKLVEGESRPHNYFSSDSRITPRVRASLVNLSIEVHQKLHLSPETLLSHLIHTGDYLGLMKFEIKSKHEGFTADEMHDILLFGAGINTTLPV